jgi:hypothetical protein
VLYWYGIFCIRKNGVISIWNVLHQKKLVVSISQTSSYLSLILTRSHVTFSICLRSSNPTTVTIIRGGSGDKAGCNLIGSVHIISKSVLYWYGIFCIRKNGVISIWNVLHQKKLVVLLLSNWYFINDFSKAEICVIIRFVK